MHIRRLWLIVIVLALVATPAAFACDGKKDAEGATTASASTCGMPAGSCCSGAKADPAKLAEAAENGCQASMATLVAMAKESGNEQAVMLASGAEGGCAKSQAALIAMAKDWDAEASTADPASPNMAQLASNAEHGCQKSEAALIEMAKKSSDPDVASLAARAENGCSASKAALIAMAQEDEDDTTAEN